MKYLIKSQDDIIRTTYEWILAMDISRNNKLLATGGYDKTLVLWDLENHKQIKEMITGFKIQEIKIDPASKFVVCGCGDYLQVQLFQITNPKKIQLVLNLELPDNIDECKLIFTPDSKHLITPTFIWNLQKRKAIRMLQSDGYDYDNSITDLSISFDQKYLMKYTSQFQIQIISFSTLDIIYENEMVQEDSQGDDLIKSMQFSTTSSKILGWCDSFIKIWEYENFIQNKDKPLIQINYCIKKLWSSPDLSFVAVITSSKNQDYPFKFSIINCLNGEENDNEQEKVNENDPSIIEQLFAISFASDLSFYVSADYNSCLRIYRRE